MEKLKILFASLICVITGCTGQRNIILRPNNSKEGVQSIYDFKVNALDGSVIDFSIYKGKKIVIMNVASKCGFTPQYADWEAFYKLKSEKVAILGFPANDFLMQEPGSNKNIEEFCQKNYGVTFQMFEKTHVKGSEKAPIYEWLTSEQKNGWNTQAPTWNFCKYIIDENGHLQGFFSSSVKPDDVDFQKALGI